MNKFANDLSKTVSYSILLLSCISVSRNLVQSDTTFGKESFNSFHAEIIASSPSCYMPVKRDPIN